MLSESSIEVPDIASLECIQGNKHAENKLICNISLDNSTVTLEHEVALDTVHTFPPTAGNEAEIKQRKVTSYFLYC